MTAWRTPLVRQAEITDTAEKNHGPLANHPDSARPRSLAGSIKQLFREAIKLLAEKAPEPEPKPRRKRTGEATGRAFRMTANKVMHRAARLPAEAYATATAYLTDTLDWLNPWHQHDHDHDDSRPAPSDHLYPHL